MDIDRFYIKEKIEEKILYIEYIPTIQGTLFQVLPSFYFKKKNTSLQLSNVQPVFEKVETRLGG